MPSEPDEPTPEPGENPPVGDLVKRSLLEIAELQDIRERAKEVAERISKLTPPPEPPKENSD